MARVQALTGKGVEALEELLDAKEFPAEVFDAEYAAYQRRVRRWL